MIKPITAESEDEPGTLQYQVSLGKDDPNEVRLWEEVSSADSSLNGYKIRSVSVILIGASTRMKMPSQVSETSPHLNPSEIPVTERRAEHKDGKSFQGACIECVGHASYPNVADIPSLRQGPRPAD